MNQVNNFKIHKFFKIIKKELCYLSWYANPNQTQAMLWGGEFKLKKVCNQPDPKAKVIIRKLPMSLLHRKLVGMPHVQSSKEQSKTQCPFLNLTRNLVE